MVDKKRMQNAVWPLLVALLVIGFGVQSWHLHRLSRELRRPELAVPPAEEPASPEEPAPEAETLPPPRQPPSWTPAPQSPFHPQGRDPDEEWNPFAEFDRMREEMDAMFARMFGEMNGRREFDRFPRHTFPRQPRLDMREESDAYHLTLEIPGATAEELETEIRDGHLHIRAIIEETREEDHPGMFLHRERRAGRFHRVLPLPEDADGQNMSVEVEEGILHITLPRKDPSLEQTI